MKYFLYKAPDGDVTKEAKVSALGFGGMRFPRNENDEIDITAAEALIDRAYEAGVNYFDTAYPYHKGKSEGFFAKALAKYPRSSYYLADKMPGWLIKVPEDTERIFNEQLERCGTEYFDFYLCHALSEKAYARIKEFGVLDFLDRMKKEGKIKRLGFSFHDTPEALEAILSDRYWDFAQIQYNYLDYTMQRAKEQVEALNRHNVPFLIMEPVRGGALAKLPEKAEALLKETAPSASAASHAMRFAMSANGVFCVLSGMSDNNALSDNIATADSFAPINAEEHNTLQKTAEIIISCRMLPCTECRYCDGCPAGINIPEILKSYNRYMSTENKAQLKSEMEEAPARPSACISCKACTSACPQHIDIPAAMEKLAKLTEK